MNYDWLKMETGPKMLVEAVKLIGVTEKAGEASNPQIMSWATEAHIKGYVADSIPWCGLFVAICAKRAGKPMPASPLWARAWRKWGNPASRPALGDVLVFSRDGGGHVGFYVGEDSTAYHVLGGNQRDKVCVTRIQRSRLIAARNFYALAAPANRRQIQLSQTGELSVNEA